MKKLMRWNLRLRLILAAGLSGYAFQSSGCLDSDIAKRFRESSGTGFIQGLSNAVTTPSDAETGLRQAATALLDGFGAVIQPRTSSSAGNQSGSSSGSQSSSSSGSSASTSSTSGSNTTTGSPS